MSSSVLQILKMQRWAESATTPRKTCFAAKTQWMLSKEISYWQEVPAKQVVSKWSRTDTSWEGKMKPDLVGKFHPNTNHELQNPTPELLNLRYHLNQELQPELNCHLLQNYYYGVMINRKLWPFKLFFKFLPYRDKLSGGLNCNQPCHLLLSDTPTGLARSKIILDNSVKERVWHKKVLTSIPLPTTH